MVIIQTRVRVVVVVSGLALAAGLLTLALLAKPAQAQAQRDRVPVVFDFLNPCTGESVVFNGTVQVFSTSRKMQTVGCISRDTPTSTGRA
jgi:hypothetical protein